MPEAQEGPTRFVALDSALILAASGAVLYFIGMIFRIARLAAIGIPLDFAREWSLQEYLLTGGVAVLVLLPAIVIVDFVLAVFAPLRGRLLSSLKSMSRLRLTIFILYALFLVAVPIVPVARLLAHTDTHYRVVGVVPKPGVALGPVVNGAYYISSTEHEIILSDRWADPNAKIVIVARDAFAEMVLSQERAGSPAASKTVTGSKTITGK
jgi:hypothetical protein